MPTAAFHRLKRLPVTIPIPVSVSSICQVNQLLPLDKAYEQEVHFRFLVQEDVVVDHGLSDICFRRTPYRHWEVDETQAPDR